MTKFEVKTLEDDVWDIRYDGPNELRLIRVQISLRRPARKWYQTKHCYTDFTYCGIRIVPLAVKRLINTYYQQMEEYEKITKFFEETH